MIFVRRHVERMCLSIGIVNRGIAQRIPMYSRSLEWLNAYSAETTIVSRLDFPILVRKPDNILVKNWDRESGRLK